jgi:hypothetical protein
MFPAKRKDAKFCSNVCRAMFSIRKTIIAEVTPAIIAEAKPAIIEEAKPAIIAAFIEEYNIPEKCYAGYEGLDVRQARRKNFYDNLDDWK